MKQQLSRFLLSLVLLPFITTVNAKEVNPVLPLKVDTDILIELVGTEDSDMKKLARLCQQLETQKDVKHQKKTEARIDLQIGMALQDNATADSYRDALQKELGIQPDMLRDQYQAVDIIKTEVTETLTQAVAKKYPLPLLEKITQEAVAAYPFYKVGDQASVKIRKRTISGRINQMSSTQVMIGSVNVKIQELDPRFDPAKMLELRQKYINERYHDRKQAYREKGKVAVPKKIFEKYGYVDYQEEWVTAQSLADDVEQMIASRQAIAAKHLEAQAERFALMKKIGIGAGAVFAFLIFISGIMMIKTKGRN